MTPGGDLSRWEIIGWALLALAVVVVAAVHAWVNNR